MNLKKISLQVMLLFLLAACSDFVDKPVSEYKIDNTALKDGDPVDVIYMPGMPDHNDDLDYYINLIVVSQTTGDTVNLLTTNPGDITKTDRVRDFISINSDVYKTIQHVEMKTEFENISEIEPKNITIVKRRRDGGMENNHYPTVIGMLGEVSNINDSLSQ